jgi:hypothetical protein
MTRQEQRQLFEDLYQRGHLQIHLSNKGGPIPDGAFVKIFDTPQGRVAVPATTLFPLMQACVARGAAG